MVPLQRSSLSFCSSFTKQALSAHSKREMSTLTKMFVNRREALLSRTSTGNISSFSARRFCTSSDKTSQVVDQVGTFKPITEPPTPNREQETRNAHHDAINSSPHNCPMISKSTMPFCYDKADFKDPLPVIRMRLKPESGVIVYKSFIIGIHEKPISEEKLTTSSYLIAYEKDSEKILWVKILTYTQDENDVGLTSEASKSSTAENPLYKISKVGDLISLQVKGDKNVYLININTGDLEQTIKFSERLHNAPDCLHMGPNDIAYQFVKNSYEQRLLGGKIANKEFEKTFSHLATDSRLIPLSTHCGLYQESSKTLLVVGPSGALKKIEDCFAAQVDNNTLFTIEKDPFNKNRCLCLIRTLQADDQVTSEVKKTIQLNISNATFGEFCHNGKLILLSGNQYVKSAVLIDLTTLTVTYSEKMFSKYCINKFRGEIWTWEGITMRLKKISQLGEITIGRLDCSINAEFVHIDESNKLYVIDKSIK